VDLLTTTTEKKPKKKKKKKRKKKRNKNKNKKNKILLKITTIAFAEWLVPVNVYISAGLPNLVGWTELVIFKIELAKKIRNELAQLQ